jgi:hypothetical protein
MARAGFAVLSIDQFKTVLTKRLEMLRDRRGETGVTTVMPIALCLVAPEHLGGDAIAKEMIRRFKLIDIQSSTAIDFYYFGWSVMSLDAEILNFDTAAFASCRDWLFRAGVQRFGGNADIVIVDASLITSRRLVLDFTEAIRVDLAKAAKTAKIDTLGDFIDSLIHEAYEVSVDQVKARRPVFNISDALALTKTWEMVLNKMLSHFGLERLESIVTRNLGPVIEL